MTPDFFALSRNGEKMSHNSFTFDQIADRNIASLRIKCTLGKYSDRMFSPVTRGMTKYYTLEKLEWMKPHLSNPNQHIAAGCLECLCAHGYDLNDSLELIRSRVNDRIFSNKVIELAEKYDKPDVLLEFVDENNGYRNRVILALKKTHHESYLTTLLLSEKDEIANSVNRIISRKN